jgi:predicted Zn finger-like uncharacterized protein
MRLVCPNCDAQYELDDTAIPPVGREVQCSACDHIWFQPNPDVPPLPRVVEVEAWPRPLPAQEPLPDKAAPEPEEQAPLHRFIDANVLAVLREEAEREAAARRAEVAAQSGPADALPPPPPPPVYQPPEPAPAAPPATVLPDVEAINSTLRARTRARREPATSKRRMDREERKAFTTGFTLVIVLAVLLTAIYVFSPSLIQVVPALAEPLQAYRDLVDGFRESINSSMEGAANALRNLL